MLRILDEVHHAFHIPEKPGMDTQLGVAPMHLPRCHVQETDLPPMAIEEHQPLEARLGQWFGKGLHLGQHDLCRLGKAHPKAPVLRRKAQALQWQRPDGQLGRQGVEHLVEHLLRKKAVGPQRQVETMLFQAAPGHHDGAAVTGSGPLCFRPTEVVETTVLLTGHGKTMIRGSRSIMPSAHPSPMKAKDVGLSILKINKSEARQRTRDGAPPTERPPIPPSGPGAPLDPGLESQAPRHQPEHRPRGLQHNTSPFPDGRRPPAASPARPGAHHGAGEPGGADLPSFTPRSVDDVDFDEEAFQSALDGSASIGSKGEEVRGTVIGHESDGIYVDIGGKAPGWMPRQECGFGVVTAMAEQFPQGKQLKVLVTGEQNGEGMVTVSLRALMARDRWSTLTRLAQEAAVVQTVISGFNRGGCTCSVEGLRGFIPRSQLVNGDDHSALVGKTVGVTVLEVDPETSKLVLSQKQASRSQRFAELQVGDLVTGRVSALKRFGCFVDLGPISGLLHQRSISGSHVGNLGEVFTVGETISALVTDVDAARGRIALNTALLENLPGEMLVAKADVMNQAEQRAERARAVLFEDQQQDQEPQAPDPLPQTHAPVVNADQSPGLSSQVQHSAPDQPVPTALVPPMRPGAPLPGDDSSA